MIVRTWPLLATALLAACDLRPSPIAMPGAARLVALPPSIHSSHASNASLRAAGMAQIVVRTIGVQGMSDSLLIELSDAEQRRLAQPANARRNTTFTVSPGTYSVFVKGVGVQFPLVRISVNIGYADTVELALQTP